MASLRTPSSRTPQPSKQMSSRLLNMKFMQRASGSAPSSPSAASTQTPSGAPGTKRRRLEDTSSNPQASLPGTPSQSSQGSLTPIVPDADSIKGESSSFGLGRGGTSTFSRGEGADTEWVLDWNTKAPAPETSEHDVGQTNSPIAGRSRLADRGDDRSLDETDVEEEDVWPSHASGRQTYGSFKKRKIRPPQTGNAEDDLENDLGESSSDTGSDIPGSADSRTVRHPPTTRSRPPKDLDSDEEMRKVRNAIEQKHRSMMGLALPGRGPNSGHTGMAGKREFPPAHSQKRRRDDGAYKSEKTRARRTM